ncbi:hypothetical protein V8F20_009821 [Naviculisporaceae sp. PSN 640]
MTAAEVFRQVLYLGLVLPLGLITASILVLVRRSSVRTSSTPMNQKDTPGHTTSEKKSDQEDDIATGGRELVPQTAELLTRSFLLDPVYNFFLSNCRIPASSQVPTSTNPDNSNSQSQSQLEPKALSTLLTGFLKACVLSSKCDTIISVDNFSSVGVLLPPKARIDNPLTILRAGIIPALFTIGPRPFLRAICEFEPAVHKLKTLPGGLTPQEIKLRKYWYVFITATEEAKRGRGLCGLLLKEMRRAVTSANSTRGSGHDGQGLLPLWLEASTEMSRDIYKRYGFKLVGEVTVGKGKVGKHGLPKQGGEGVTVWGMIWRP